MTDRERDSEEGTGHTRCESVRECLSLGSRATWPPPVEAHVASCPECAAEAAFLRRVEAARPDPPSDLAARIVAHALFERNGANQPRGVTPIRRAQWWATPAAAAAVLVLALGVGMVSQGLAPSAEDGMIAYLQEGSDGWQGAEWFVAGAPFFEGVSDETLALLAAELEP